MEEEGTDGSAVPGHAVQLFIHVKKYSLLKRSSAFLPAAAQGRNSETDFVSVMKLWDEKKQYFSKISKSPDPDQYQDVLVKSWCSTQKHNQDLLLMKMI